MIHPLRLYGDPVLRRSAAPVRRFDEELRTLATDMSETMHDAAGVGLAAPQIGRPLRLFVALELAEHDTDAEPSAANPTEADGDGDGDDDGGDGGDEGDDEGDEGDERPEPTVLHEHVMVNPEITHADGRRVAPDGCLSVPGVWIENMVRHQRIRVRYQDLDGAWHERDAEGHFAHVIQHETDHLDGILFFDRLEAEDRARFLDAYRSELAELQRRAKAHLKELRRSSAATPA
ncbi:MAG: peptide deformylase [Trueperaceae bacterium]